MSPFSLEGARILITNDDGIGAEGLAVLEEIASGFSDDVWVVAPSHEQSACSHSLTIHRPLRLNALGERRYTVDGTPTDCVLIALQHLLLDHRPQLLLSGINHGFNVADDVTYSGTLAGAMEATLFGVPAIACSQEMRDHPLDWSLARQTLPDLLARLVKAGWAENSFVSINLPAVRAEDCTGIHVVPAGPRKIGDNLHARIDPRGRAYYWIGGLRPPEALAPETDMAVIAKGGISVTVLKLDLNDQASMDRMRAEIGQSHE